VALFDNLGKELPDDLGAVALMWDRREIENYLCTKEVLLAYARHDQPDNLFGQAEANQRQQVMSQAIAEVSDALRTLRKCEPWSPKTKVTDDFLDPLFEKYFERLKLPNLFRKSDYHLLARLVPKDKIDPEVAEKLDAIVDVASQAKPRRD
jgi:hypothetical protein